MDEDTLWFIIGIVIALLVIGAIVIIVVNLPTFFNIVWNTKWPR